MTPPSNSKAKGKGKYIEPAITQGDLSKFLGTEGHARQKTLASMFKHAPTHNGSDPGRMEIDADAEKIMVDAVGGTGDSIFAEDVKVPSPNKERSIAPSPVDQNRKHPHSDEEDSKGPVAVHASGSSKKVKTDPSAIASPPKPSPSSPIISQPKPPLASMFASKVKQGPTRVDSKTIAGTKDAKGKGRAKVPDSEEDEGEEVKEGKNEEDEEDEEDDESDSEPEDVGTLADIFTKKPLAAPSVGGGNINWKAGEPVPYSALTSTFKLIEGTTKRLEISAFLTHFLVDVIRKTPGDLLKAVYLCINRLCPDYEALELGIGESLLMKAIGESTGRTLANLKKDYKDVGDLGELAKKSRKAQSTLYKPKALTVASVFASLTTIAKTSGAKAQTLKVGMIVKLLASCGDIETKFLIRSLGGKLRIGLAERTVLVALAHAIVTADATKDGNKWSRDRLAKELELGTDIVKAVFSELPSYDLLIPALLKKGIHHLKEACFLTPGVPLKPMLAKPTKAITEVLDRFEGKRFTCEYKYDGERAQVHFLEDGSIKIFSRNSEDMSMKYPDIVAQLPKCIKAGTKSFIIDAEAVAWDKNDKRLLPFQDLSRRKRKDVKAEDITVKVHLFAFDLLYLNGKPLLAENLERRRQLLHDSLQAVEEEFSFATSDDATSVEDIQIFLDKSIKDGCEGLMVKMLEGEGASYEPSRRSINWLKLKKDYLAGAGDSFDLVVIGADYGKGKRTKVYGAFHLGCWDLETEKYQVTCKIGTGFSDEILKAHFDELHPLELAQISRDYNIGDAPKADVYFKPKVVWEVLAADLSLSPIYTAAQGKCSDRGISLRFPRFIRSRPDKGPEESTDPDQIADAYRAQATTAPKGKFGKKGGGGEDDGFW